MSDQVVGVNLNQRELWQLVALLEVRIKEMEEPDVLDPDREPELSGAPGPLGKIQAAQAELGRQV